MIKGKKIWGGPALACLASVPGKAVEKILLGALQSIRRTGMGLGRGGF